MQMARKINTITIMLTTFSNQGFSFFIKRGGMPIFYTFPVIFLSLFPSDKTASPGSIISLQFLFLFLLCLFLWLTFTPTAIAHKTPSLLGKL